ncbi:hypothetical protein [Halorussus marinus]|uniref:hypothetical protein n=1 Tax=Halorussus marinus TaxID=2505976 RepID=UPI00106E472B|nr:hypothetical protein [Halorussus marinus]
MNRTVRYAVGVAVGLAVPAAVAAAAPTSRVPILLVAIAQVYAVGTAIALRFPDRLRRTDAPNWTSGAFAGVLTFGTTALLQGVDAGPTLAATVLGWGLAGFGFVTGIAYERGESGSQ